MEAVGRYIASVCAAAVLCGMLNHLLPGGGAAKKLLRLISGIFLAFVAVQPLAEIELGALPVLSGEYFRDAQAASAEGEEMASEAISAIIKEQTEAYILDKARQLQADLTVEVTLSQDPLPTPVAVRLEGTISPYNKAKLAALLAQELGIAKECQIWIG